MIKRMVSLLLLMMVMIAGAMAPDGGPVAEEASSPNYVLESSVVASSGGESSSPGFSVSGVAGQTIEPGFAEGVEFNADNGFLNDSDLDADGIGGSEDLCPSQFAGCSDLDHDGCIDLPDPGRERRWRFVFPTPVGLPISWSGIHPWRPGRRACSMESSVPRTPPISTPRRRPASRHRNRN